MSADNNAIFSEIYEKHIWGGRGMEGFYSGTGSRDADVIGPYIRLLGNILLSNEIKSIVEIGCGDFYIMNKVLEIFPYIEYVGIDVANGIAEYNNEHFGNEKISFRQGDAVDKEFDLPKADLLIVRQVLQHLDNESVKVILDRAESYRYALITEHISDAPGFVRNLDKPTGHDTRLFKNSGVYIDYPPFSKKNVIHLLSVCQMGGVIRTSLMINDVFDIEGGTHNDC